MRAVRACKHSLGVTQTFHARCGRCLQLSYNEFASKLLMMPSTYSFIIPAYNESERLAVSLPKILDYVRKRELRSEIIVVNDGSSDDTAEVVRSFMAHESGRPAGGESRQSRQGLQRAQRHAATRRAT